ncbi:hypothetical protein SAMN05192583_3381 [Sphingomonas gellani]|uniref:Uncharacterized protein n=1 Tax=Sphingomonas gellani TaxID=1166340 RepID=A0A1H8IW36_9SPHN|nr:hypothetical protein [Sphingomonas gellani]SEN71908.1 hypothetical protein SAMN05192583_3381 [Sphingomonas gellani]
MRKREDGPDANRRDEANGSDDGAWFAPKAFGYGAGLPIAWQGWVLIGVYSAVMIVLVNTLAKSHPVLFYSLTAVLTAGLIVLSARHTRGGWRWRWGGD